MLFTKIPLKIETTPTAHAQPYDGPQIVQIIGVGMSGNTPTIYATVDPTKKLQCDHFVQRLNQPLDAEAKTPNGDPIEQGPWPKVISGVLPSPWGSVIVSSYCVV